MSGKAKNKPEEEVDEVSEVEVEITRTTKTSDPSLDEFLQEMFQTSTQEESGMPTLDWLKSQFRTKSAAIRYLHEQGYSVNQIHKHLGVKYQHVRNVLHTKLKRGPNEDFHLKEGQVIASLKGLSDAISEYAEWKRGQNAEPDENEEASSEGSSEEE